MAFGTPYYIGSSTPSASTTQTITVGTATSAGDAIIVSTGCSSTSVTVSGIIDSSSNTYTAAIPAVTSDEFGQVWIAPDSAALTTSDTITVTYVGSGGEKLAVAVGVSGVATSSEVDSAKASAQASTGSPSVTSGTLAHASELAIGVIFNKSTGGAPSGFGSFAETTSQQSGTSPYVTVCYLDTASTTAVTFSATITSTDWSAFIIPLLSGGNTSNLTLAGTVNVAPAIVRTAGRPLAATITAGGRIVRGAGKPVTATVNAAAAVTRQVARPLAATVTAATVLQAARNAGESLTVTGSITNPPSVGLGLSVRVLTGAAAATAQPGATFASGVGDNLVPQYGLTPTGTGSYIYGCTVYAPATTATVDANTTSLLNYATSSVAVFAYRGTGKTTSGVAVTYGGSAPAATGGDFVQAEILASGTLAEDASSPAAVTSATASSLTTASFTPPSGSLLVAIITGVDSSFGADISSITDTAGLTWTQLVYYNGAGGVSAIWAAQAPTAHIVTLPAALTAAAALARRPGKALTATIATAATLTLRAGKALTVVANVAATLLRGIQRPVAGTVNVQATVPRTATRILAAALPAAAALTRKTGKPLPAVVTAAAAAAFSTGKVLAAAMSTAAALARNTGKTLTVAINAAAAGTITKVRQVVLAAAVTVSGGMGRQAGKLLTAAVNTAASAGRVISRTLSAVADLAVTVAIGGHSVVYQLTLAAASSVTSTVTAAAGRLVVIWSTGMARLKWTAGGARTRWKTITGRWKWPSGPSRG